MHIERDRRGDGVIHTACAQRTIAEAVVSDGSEQTEVLLESQLSENIASLCRAYVGGLRAALGDRLYAVYVYGACVFPETATTSDVDLHVILRTSIDDEERAAIQKLHQQMAVGYPPMGADLDAYFLLLEQARLPALPVHQLQTNIVDESWALHRAHMLAGRCVVLYGPQPHAIFPVPSWPEIDKALLGELAYVKDHLADYPDYCILNLCRLMMSYRTRDVVISKAAAGRWAGEEFPQWRKLIQLASQSYAGKPSVQDREMMLKRVSELFTFAVRQIAIETSARESASRR